MHVLSAPPAFVLSQDQTLSLNPRNHDPPPTASRSPGMSRHLHTGRKQITPSTSRKPQAPDRRTTDLPAFFRRCTNDPNAACTSPLHIIQLVERTTDKAAEAANHIRSVRKDHERAPRRKRYVSPTNQPIKQFFRAGHRSDRMSHRQPRERQTLR